MGIVYATASKLLVSLLIATALVAFQFVACKGTSCTWSIEDNRIRGLKGFRNLQEQAQGSETTPQDGQTTDDNNGVAIGGAFGSGQASASASSTGAGQQASAFGNSATYGYSSSYAYTSSGESAVAGSRGIGPAEASASAVVVDEGYSASYGNAQNSGYAASISVTGDVLNLNDIAEDLISETSNNDTPFFGLFGSFTGGGGPDDSASDTTVPDEDASGEGTSGTETVAGANDSNGASVATEIANESTSEGGYYGAFGAGP